MKSEKAIDLFENYDEIPSNIKNIFESYEPENGLSYTDCRNMQAEIEAAGYTFEWGLDAEPFGLRKIYLK